VDEVTLREVRDEDLEILFPFQLDPEATEMAAFPARDRDAFIEHWEKIRANASIETRVIEFGGVVAGDIVSWPDGDHRDVGYWIAKRFWGRGIATRALARFVEEVVERRCTRTSRCTTAAPGGSSRSADSR